MAAGGVWWHAPRKYFRPSEVVSVAFTIIQRACTGVRAAALEIKRHYRYTVEA